MQYEQFIARVQEAGGFADEEAAGAVTQATLTTLGATLPGEDARRVAEELPDPLSSWLTAEAGTGQDAEPLPPEDVLVRIDDAVDSSELTTGDVGAVLRTLREALPTELAERVFGQLPPELDRLAR